ncbi:AI-2E family transporter [Inhella gelatinilytica]|uniref:AI-2E family transporter n=1 Tax=Inhella gelatinilytica TaxID=2795030 RepID=A0A931IWG8_9BURK|nr:AI-2E family transporter [Inhella gelatinilytica]MBH9552836.1 AI-2E family transporter [Inhella gelatinilytica]
MNAAAFKLSPAQRRGLAWTALALGVAILVWALAPVLTPFVAAAVLAYALDPMVERLSKRMPRVLAVVLVESVTLALVLAVLLLIVPILSKELPLLKAQIPVVAARINQDLMPFLQRLGISASLDVAAIKDFVIRHLGANADDVATALLGSVRIGGSLVLALVGYLVLIPVVLFYLLLDWPQLRERAWSLVPPRVRPPLQGYLDEVDTVLGSYLRGQLLVMGALALYYTVTLGLAGFDLALPLGVFTGLAIFVPYIGFGLGLVLTLLAAALQFANLYGLLAVAVIFGVGQLIEGFFLTPRLIGERIGLSPLMVIFVLLAFGHVLGFVGVLLALPLSAVALVGLKRAHRHYLDSGLYRG